MIRTILPLQRTTTRLSRVAGPLSATEILVGRQKRYSSSLLSISAASSNSFVRSCVIPQTNNTHQGVTRFPTSSLTTTTLRNMSRDVSSQSNIAISKTTDQDGSFNRRPSTFRDVIEKGGKHEPEKGEHIVICDSCPVHLCVACRPLPSLCIVCVPMGSPNAHHERAQGPRGLH